MSLASLLLVEFQMKTADFEKNFSSMHESGSAMQMMLREETPLVVNFDFSLAHKFW